MAPKILEEVVAVPSIIAVCFRNERLCIFRSLAEGSLYGSDNANIRIKELTVELLPNALTGNWPKPTFCLDQSHRRPARSHRALLIGDAETVAKKILYVNEALGGISRLTFQMGVSTLPHPKMLRAIEILGTQVAPAVRNALAIPART